MRARTRTILTCTALCTLLVPFGDLANAGEEWYAVGSDGQVQLRASAEAQIPELTRVESDQQGLQLDLHTPGLSVRKQNTQGGEFVVLSWPDAATTGEIGAPLPVIRRAFYAPGGVQVTVETDLGQATLLGAQALGGAFEVLPVQRPVPKLPGAWANAPFDYDAEAYNHNAALPAQRATAHEVGLVRGERLFLLEMRPLAHNPVTQSLTLWTDMTVTIHFEGQPTPSQARTPLPGLQQAVLNPELLQQHHRTVLAGEPPTYLIVCASAFVDHAKMVEFEAAKLAQGFDVQMYAVTPGTSASEIKDYIYSTYLEATELYVVLVGDTDTIPHWVGGGAGSPHTDLPYSCMDGSSDWHPDIPLGRFSARNTTQLSAIVDKSLSFEARQFADSSYTGRAVFMASLDNYHISEGTHNYVINTYMDPLNMASTRLFCSQGATTQDVRDAFNAGQLYGVYSGHGGTYSWADGPVFSQGDVNGLTNFEMYPWVLSFACVTGTYTADECFMETWVRAPGKGAVASWGSSVNSYWTEDDVLEKRLFDVMFVDDVRELAPLYNATKYVYEVEMGSGSTTRRYFEMYNHMGDPCLYIPYNEAGLRVTPSSNFLPEGPEGGPFLPASKTYQLQNLAEYAIDYEVTHDPDATWCGISGVLSGSLEPAATTDLLVEVTAEAQSLAVGSYSDTIVFTNLTDGIGNTARDVQLEVGVATVQHAWDMEVDPQWLGEDQWAFGIPAGLGGAYGNPDPTSGHTGLTVCGFNLDGDYPNSMPERHLTTTAINCTDMMDVSLKFWRWLNVETSSYDHAYLRISTDGSTWTTVWENEGEITDGTWSQLEYDISDIADGVETVYVRWTMGTTDGSWQYNGWNIDDVEVYGVPLVDCNDNNIVDHIDISTGTSEDADGNGIPDECECPADLDGSGEVDFGDILAVLAAWGNLGGSEDLDDSGTVDFGDLLIVLSSWGPCE